MAEVISAVVIIGIIIKLTHRTVFRGLFKAIFGFSWDKEC